MSGQMKSIPATSSPTIRAAVSAISTLSGWASIVRSIDVPPVDMLPVSASLIQVPAGRHGVELPALGPDELLGAPVELDPGQDLLVADAAARVLVGQVDELADGLLAVGGDRGRHPLGDRGDLAADDEAAVVLAGDVRLDDDVAAAALAERAVEGRPDGLVRAQVEMDAAAVVAVERLDDAREAEPLGRRDRGVLGVDDLGLAAPAGRPSRAAGWSGSCRSRCRPRSRSSGSSSSPGSAAGGRPGRAGRASTGRAG